MINSELGITDERGKKDILDDRVTGFIFEFHKNKLRQWLPHELWLLEEVVFSVRSRFWFHVDLPVNQLTNLIYAV